MPYIEVPILNPCNVVDKRRSLPAPYNFKHFDAWLGDEQVLPLETWSKDIQIWEFTDIFRVQVYADISPVRLRIRNERGAVVLQQIMDQVGIIAGKVYYQAQVAFDDPVFAEGGYFLPEMYAGDGEIISTEFTIWDVREKHYGSMLFRYGNLFNNDIIWEWREYMEFRTHAVIPYDSPGSVRTGYVDQPGAQVTVKGTSFRKFKLYIGQFGGLYPWQIDKMDDIINQNNFTSDGKPFAAVSGAAWSTKKIDRYPRAQWNIDMRETVNRRARRFEATGLQEKKVVIDYAVSLKLFGPTKGSANDNSIFISHIE